MKTKIYDVRGKNPSESIEILEAADLIKAGGIVAFPTETVYGLGADALDSLAVSKIYKAKGRPADNPIIVHIGRVEDLDLLTDHVTSDVLLLAENFWPGPLTLILNKKELVPDITTGGLKTVAVRMPDSEIALELIKKSGKLLAAPSANISGKPSPTKGDHVVEDLSGRIEGIIIGEDCRVGIESTVLDMTGSFPVILRPGVITKEEIGKLLGKKVELGPEKTKRDVAKSPGTKYAHYKPEAEMILLKGQRENVLREIAKMRENNPSLCLGIIDTGAVSIEEATRTFFGRLRQLDEEKVDLIVGIAPDQEESLGYALYNRMLKAASNKCKHISE